ncbi:ABC transporter ATP-binding protein [Spirochaeta cellobiosiphila]|uniref:ABC transporter ATP-binding protein n=1 Tax=Spirochaeta cellobiosiphila TaxID=504483 RepID=UPI0003FCCEC8|nr:ABC transporter ATP-binding protein [Spirochaeta cellobiosiphila]
MNTLRKLQNYMEGRKIFLPIALLFSALSALLGMAPYIFIWQIIKILLGGSYSQKTITDLSLLTIATGIGGVISYCIALSLSHLAAFRVENRLRAEGIRKMINKPLGFFSQRSTGAIRKIIDDNVSITHSFLAHQLPDLAGTIVIPIASLVMIFAFDWRFGLVSLIPMSMAFFLMTTMMSPKGRQFMMNYMGALEDMNTEAVEYVRGIPVVKVFQQSVFSFKNFHKTIINYKNMVAGYTNMWETPMSLYTTVINSFAYLFIPLALFLFSREPSSTVITNVLFYILITPIFTSNIMRSMHINEAFAQAKEALSRIETLLKADDRKEPTHSVTLKDHSITFQDVNFAYPDSQDLVLNKINYVQPEGTTYALVGPSGSGKTSIARLIPRFWDCNEGQVQIGGVNVCDIPKEQLMNSISFVFQQTRLFKGTIKDNLLIGKPKATDDQILQCLSLAHCEDIIQKLPEGLDSLIGPGGTYLSGGEQQRIALARAILKDAPIIILDEATAFTDPENEHLIQKAFNHLTKGKTVLMIAHRLTSVIQCDKILVIKEGQILEEGTHTELLQKESLYTYLWEEYQRSISWKIGKEVVNV